MDQDLCIGCELCVSICPEVFEMSGDTAVPRVEEVPPALEDEVREASESCPVEAIPLS